LIQGELDEGQITRLAAELLADVVVEETVVGVVGDEALLAGSTAGQASSGTRRPESTGKASGTHTRPTVIHVLPKPGVMDPVAASTQAAIADFGMKADAVRTLKKYWVAGLAEESISQLCSKLLANDAIEQAIVGPLPFRRLEVGAPYQFKLTTVAIRAMDDEALRELSLKGQLYLSLTEMQTIRDYFKSLDRDPTDVELETVAQTWSEHCSHKTLAGRIRYVEKKEAVGDKKTPDPFFGEKQFQNMLKETIFAATQEIRKRWREAEYALREKTVADAIGEEKATVPFFSDWCVSVFADNAGVIRFDEDYNVVFKVETHNHPSALEPYGGANTGIGGVIRDPMGTGMGAKPICNTDVFCFAPPDTPAESLPPGVLHPRRVMKGVVSGVRDYGNRMGIPTVNGAIYFDPRYLGNPLVYCGNVGIIPRDKSFKHQQPGDYIVAVGGRTGRDGIHGATFSSAELHSESDSVSGGAVQIGNAITEKMVLDVLLVARDRGLYNAVTDCGAGGFSSAVGEMGEKIGAEVWLDRIPLKYEGLSYTEMWISEAQERMVFSVSPEQWPELEKLCASEGVEATVIGEFRPTKRLMLKYHENIVADLAMEFLHDGRPPVVREAVYAPPASRALSKKDESGERARTAESVGTAGQASSGTPRNPAGSLRRILSSLNVCSKEWVIRQYDHEVQAGSVIKPLVGVENDGPSDAAVVRPVLTSRRGLVISCGMNPRYGDFDTYWMAASAIDEAIRNAVAVGADPQRLAILDNFCWGNTDRPETLGSLVRAALACHDMAIALETPFISGKDSLNNEFRPAGADPISIPPSLLISAMGQVEDVGRCVSMDLKRPGNLIYIVGETKNELGGSHFAMVEGLEGGEAPKVDFEMARKTFAAIHEAINAGLVRSCHDLSEGGLAAAIAEMAFAGGFGAKIDLKNVPCAEGVKDATVLLFSESNTRFVCEVTPENAAAFEAALQEVPCGRIGSVTENADLRVSLGTEEICENIAVLKEAWQKPLRW
jgi:phosphoribosylformylglycinamidine synthase